MLCDIHLKLCMDLAPSQWKDLIESIQSKKVIDTIIRHLVNLRAASGVERNRFLDWLGLFFVVTKKDIRVLSVRENSYEDVPRCQYLTDKYSSRPCVTSKGGLNSSSRRRNWTFIWGEGLVQWVLSQNPGKAVLFPLFLH